jgi:hypothetical protein
MKQRSLSASQAIQIRSDQIKPLATQHRLSVSGSASKESPPNQDEQEKEKRLPAMAASESLSRKSITIAVDSPPRHGKRREPSWSEKVWGRKRRAKGYEV